MPRRRKPPRLWERKDENTWVILDGQKQTRTGFSLDQCEEAERAFQEYLTNKLTGLPIPVDPNEITIGEILCRYAEDKGRKQKSPERTAYAIQALAPFWGGLSPNDITEQKCFSYQQSRDVMASTVRRELGVLNAALNHAGKAFRLPNLPKAELPPKSEPLNRWLTRDEVAQLRQHALPHLDRFIILSLFTGRRKKAILDLRWERSPQNGWIDLDMGMIHFKGYAETESSKRRGSITMPSSLHKLAKEWHKDGQKSVIHYNDKPVSDVDTSFDRACKLCGFTDVVRHTLKHTAVTWAFQEGMTVEDAFDYFATSHETLLKVYRQHSPLHQQRPVAVMDQIGTSFIAGNIAEYKFPEIRTA